jgi:polyphosphate kinase
MELYLRDNTHAWILQSDGNYIHTQPQKGEEAIDAQAILLERWATHML